MWGNADEPGRSGDQASAEKQAPSKQTPQSAGAHEDGRSNDPAYAEKTEDGSGTDVTGAGASQEPGRSNDPASAEKQKQ